MCYYISMNTKKCEYCGTTEGRIIYFKKKRYLCNRHRIQYTRHKRFIHTHIDGNEFISEEDYHLMSIRDIKGNIIRYVKVDTGDRDLLKKYIWFGYGGYAAAWIDGKKVLLHHFLIGKQAGLYVDHKNTNKADNRKSNLRHVSPSENAINRGKMGGIYWDKVTKKWGVTLEFKKKRYWLGRHKSLEDAVRVRAAAELEIVGINTEGTLKALNSYNERDT